MSSPAEIAPPFVSPYTLGWGIAYGLWQMGLAPSSATHPSANIAFYYPVSVPVLCVARRVWWANGDTVSSSYNVDCGIYADSGYQPAGLLASSGSTAQGTALEIQFVDITDTVLTPGRYWIAISCSSTSATFIRTLVRDTVSTSIRRLASFRQSTAVPLPATATPVSNGAYGAVYLCGFATTASP
jgi:hypothetical protein